jgi:AsmA protein
VQRDPKRRTRTAAPAPPINGEFILAPTTLNLGAKDPAQIEGRFDHSGYQFHLTGSALPSRLLALGAALPQFGDGLADALPPPSKDAPARAELPIRLDLTSTRQWFGPQTWSKTTVQTSAKPTHRHR